MKGKYVVALVNDPGLVDSTLFRGKILTYYGRWTYKIEEARRQGAAGILLFTRPKAPPTPGPRCSPAGRGRRASGGAAGLARGRRLGDQRRLRDGSSSKAARASPILPPPRRSRVPRHPARHSDRGLGSEHDPALGDGQRARPAPGEGSAGPRTVLIGGHYDHFGIGAPVEETRSTRGRRTTPQVPPRSSRWRKRSSEAGCGPPLPRVRGFAAEESGLIGSQALADNPVPLKDIAAILNLDVVNLYGRTREFRSGARPVLTRQAFARPRRRRGSRSPRTRRP